MNIERPRRPTAEELRAAGGRRLPDVIAPGLRVLFCGINPGLYTAAVGHHFARPGNRFWKALHQSGFTPRLLRPEEEQELLRYGLGITNIANRPSTAAAEISRAELEAGARELEARVLGRRKAAMGPQEETVGGARVWVLPNPSGLNANYRPDDFARLFGQLRLASEAE